MNLCVIALNLYKRMRTMKFNFFIEFMNKNLIKIHQNLWLFFKDIWYIPQILKPTFWDLLFFKSLDVSVHKPRFHYFFYKFIVFFDANHSFARQRKKIDLRTFPSLPGWNEGHLQQHSLKKARLLAESQTQTRPQRIRALNLRWCWESIPQDPRKVPQFILVEKL